MIELSGEFWNWLKSAGAGDVLTASAAVLATTVASLAAIVIYPRQKQIDRKEASRAKLFELQMEISDAVGTVMSHAMGQTADSGQHAYSVSVSKYALFAHPDEVKALGRFNHLMKHPDERGEGSLEAAWADWINCVRKRRMKVRTVSSREILDLTPLNLKGQSK